MRAGRAYHEELVSWLKHRPVTKCDRVRGTDELSERTVVEILLHAILADVYTHVCRLVCIRVCAHVYIYVHTHVSTHVCSCTRAYKHVYTHVPSVRIGCRHADRPHRWHRYVDVVVDMRAGVCVDLHAVLADGAIELQVLSVGVGDAEPDERGPL